MYTLTNSYSRFSSGPEVEIGEDLAAGTELTAAAAVEEDGEMSQVQLYGSHGGT